MVHRLILLLGGLLSLVGSRDTGAAESPPLVFRVEGLTCPVVSGLG